MRQKKRIIYNNSASVNEIFSSFLALKRYFPFFLFGGKMGNCEITPLIPDITSVSEFVAMSALDQLKTLTKVVADTGDFAAMEKFKPEVWYLL